VAFFPRVGAANEREYKAMLEAGVPTVVHETSSKGLINHEVNGFIYRHESWAKAWIKNLVENLSLREKVRSNRKPAPVIQVEATTSPSAQATHIVSIPNVMVTAITPTFQRNLKVIARCIDCMRLQTDPRWEMLVCSDGAEEMHVRDLIHSLEDPRIHYHHTSTAKREGDYGNTVRSEMLKLAKGKYIMFLDDDNLVLPHYVEHMMAALDAHPEAGFTVARIMHFGPLNESVVGKPPRVLTGIPVKLYHIDPLQVMVRTNVMREVGWDTEVGYLSDGVTLEKLGKDHRHVEVCELLGIHL